MTPTPAVSLAKRTEINPRNTHKLLKGTNSMKTIVRTAVAALVLTGAFASTQISSASATKVTVARNSALPVPMCAPDDPNACGIAR
jgi:hypothetical protein